MPQPSPTLEECVRQWAEQCPLITCADYRFSEVTIIVHQGRVVGCDIRLKHRYTADSSPPVEADDSDHTNGAVRITS